MSSVEGWNTASALELVRKCVSRELTTDSALPDDGADLVKAGIIDSMGWIGILSSIEEATGIPNFGQSWPEGRPQSIRSLGAVVCEITNQPGRESAKEVSQAPEGDKVGVCLAGWGYALGSLIVPAEQVERECGLVPGTIRLRAGIQSLRRAEDDEDEVVLGQRAAELAIKAAGVEPDAMDFVVATSATFLNYPSLAATLHSRLLLRDSCGAFDVGGACVGTLYALATAKAFLASVGHGVALVVGSEVHSQRLSSREVPGEFRGLFGDGACAFVLTSSDLEDGGARWRLGDFIWGCSGTSASSLRLALRKTGELDVQFKGEQLASAALSQMNQLLVDLEARSGRPRSEVDYFALHEPNPRLVELLAHKGKIPVEKIALLSQTSGNLGSATCGVSLCAALTKARATSNPSRRPLIFVAAVGPGLVWGGTYLHQDEVAR